MMLSLATAALLTAAAAPLPVSADPLTHLFLTACFDGKVQTAWSASPIEFSALPSALRGRLGTPSEAQVWQIGGATPGYLYSLKYSDRRFSPKICGVASEGLAIRPAASAVEARLYGRPSSVASNSTEWLNDKAGYRALATRKGNFTILQVNWLKDNQQAEATPTQ